MKHSKEQIRTIAIKILKDLNPEYFQEGQVNNLVYAERDEVSRPRGKILPTWAISIIDPYFDAYDFLVISDETGEPLYYQNFNGIIAEIEKGEDGTYKTKD